METDVFNFSPLDGEDAPHPLDLCTKPIKTEDLLLNNNNNNRKLNNFSNSSSSSGSTAEAIMSGKAIWSPGGSRLTPFDHPLK